MIKLSSKPFICNHCGTLFLSPTCSCPHCGARIEKHDPLNPGSALGLIGLTCSGKTMYLTTLHNQLMHSVPEWHVEVSYIFFELFTSRYQHMRRGNVLDATALRPADYFLMKVLWRNRKLDLIMWDIAGEIYRGYAKSELESYDPELELLLSNCRSVMVAILCSRMQNTTDDHVDPYDEDEVLCRIFRKILRTKNYLRQAIVLLIGVDVYGSTPEQAHQKSLEDYERIYQIFPGFLKNAGIKVETVPLSNIGLGNTIDKGRIASPPTPYNVLQPLRLAYPTYLPWWDRWLLHFTKADKISQVLRGDAEAKSLPHLHTEISSTEQAASDSVAADPLTGLSEQKYLAELRQLLSDRFDEGELRTLCFDLGVDYDSLPGMGKADRARELINYFARRNRIQEIANAVSQQRPDIRESA